MTTYHIAFWNVENLFDVHDSPHRPDWLQRTLQNELENWDEPVLARKVSQLSAIIRKMNAAQGPDMLALCEIENRPVLERLVGTLAPLKRDYGIAHEDSRDKRGIDVAFVFDRAMFEKREQFSHSILKRTATRDLFQVNFGLRSGKEFFVIGNHWPSRRGEQYASEPYRILAGETLAYFHERIREIKGSDAPILVMGDFNDEPFDRSLVQYALSTRQSERVLNARSPRLLNLMWPLLGERAGTYYHSNLPKMLDQFLASQGLIDPDANLSLIGGSVAIEAYPEMVNTGTYPSPIAFGRPAKPSTYNRCGFRDHFPISVKLVEA